ncbi:hypothetical protein [Streptacidiphilus jiangxiensis]|uniref:Uncharacterized membrane protein YfcA n=1 Tax=Streptacidiphilus jiangxiensis TaxID=235985 RepID=A0A1H7Y0M0_STRJI|nr:hypothetical protein [Streptacidiphilus jiangxiensis]SEM39533.1 Uncharacterized membrane protein YfcA [Streptacidiphilus jiangxiensis]
MSEYPQSWSGYPIDPAATPAPSEGDAADAAARTAYLPPVPAAPQGYPEHPQYPPYPAPPQEAPAGLPPYPAHPLAEQPPGYPAPTPSAPGAGFPAHPADQAFQGHQGQGHLGQDYQGYQGHPAAGLAGQGYPGQAGADQTALLPPIPGQPESEPESSSTGQSRFDHIQAKYGAAAEQPQTPAPAAPAPVEAGQGPSWPDGWDRPASPPRAWAPAPQPAAPFPPGGYGHDPLSPTTDPLGAPAGAHQPYAGPGPSFPTPGPVPQAAAYTGPAPVGDPLGAPVGPHQPFPPQGPFPGPGAPQQSFGQDAAGGGSLREAFAAAQPTGPGAGAPQGPFAGPGAPQQALGQDAAGGGSLREAFAAAQPTGPRAGQAAAVVAPAVAAAPPARSGSPIIDPGVQPGAITLVLGALIGVAALAGKFGLVVPVALLQAVTAAGWFRLNGMWPARQGIALAALGGFVADAAILAASAHSTGPAILAGALGGFFLLVLILQIFRPSNPDERFYALTVCASATVVTVLAGAYLAVGSGKAVLAGAIAAGVSAAVSAALRKPAVAGFAAGGLLGVLVGGGLGLATGLGLTQGLLLGLGAGVCALIGRRVAAYDFPSRFVHMTAGIALPLALAAPMVYLIAR